VLDLDEAIDRSLGLVGSTGDVTLGTETDGNLELTQRAWTIPLELTSNVRFLYIVSLYGGVGVDFQFGSASMSADVESPLTDGETEVGRITVDADDDAGPTPVLVRFLTGLQLNFGPIKAFAQLNFLTENLAVGLAGGLRAVF